MQKKYGLVGVKYENGNKYVVMVSSESGSVVKIESVPVNQKMVYLKVDCDFRDLADLAKFYYSLEGKTWNPIGSKLKMEYTLPHFMGYRFGLFNYATKNTGGFVDFDWFRINN